jgi:DnaJ-class molecular chaperone
LEAETYYSILQVARNTSDTDIKKSFRKLSKEYHPDKNPNGEEHFKKINEAYSTLSDKKKRAEYDYQLDHPVTANPANDPYSRFRNVAFSMMDLEHLNIHVDRHFKISELMNGIEDSVSYQISKSSLSESKIEHKTVRYKVNLSTNGYPLALIGGKLGIIVRMRYAGSSQEIDGFDDVFHRRHHGEATGDLFIRIIIDTEGLEITDASDLVQTVELSLSDILFTNELFLQNPFGKKYKINSINSPTLSNIQVRIPEQGLVSAFGKRGSYIFNITVKKPDLSKISDDKLATLKELLRDFDK